MINKMQALVDNIGIQSVGSNSSDRERFWLLYNKYKDDMPEILELMNLMQQLLPKEERKDEN